MGSGGDSPVEITNALLFATFWGNALNILYVAIGLGLVIFFHEMGHFAVAKWCNVRVERFSMGFGPILWSFKIGETEYAFSLIPFGGYVKMLGQDDMDPSQLTSEEIAEDPRAYSSKSVPQRMAIISAGVIMNVITGMLFYALAFGYGVRANPPKIGTVRVGMPAWKAGLRQGDEITSINGREMESYRDIQMAIALSDGDVEILAKRNGKALGSLALAPDRRGTRPVIGIGPAIGRKLIEPPPDSEISVTVPGTPADRAKKPGFKPGDDIAYVDDVKINGFATLQRVLAEKRNMAVVFRVRRAGGPEGEYVKIKVDTNPFRTLGLSMDIGEVAAIRSGSPATRAVLHTSEKKTRKIKLQAGDKITEVNGKPLGKKLNPLRLPDLFETAARNRDTVELKVLRKEWGDLPKRVTVKFQKNDPVIPAWTEQPTVPGAPLSIPSLGIAFHMIPTVIKVDSDSPAGRAVIK